MEIAINWEFYLTVLLRVGFAIFLGFILGYEREITGKFAGLRTHILVSVGAAVFTLLSLYGFKYLVVTGTAGVNDPARIAAQVITGIGFIGAGTVMRHGTNIFGITTAATLWVAAAVGMASGCGEFFIGFIAAISTLLVLIVIRHFEKRFILNRIINPKIFEISFVCDIEYADSINKIIEENFKFIEKFKKKIRSDGQVSIKFTISSRRPISKINSIFRDIGNIDSLEILEVHEW